MKYLAFPHWTLAAIVVLCCCGTALSSAQTAAEDAQESYTKLKEPAKKGPEKKITPLSMAFITRGKRLRISVPPQDGQPASAVEIIEVQSVNETEGSFVSTLQYNHEIGDVLDEFTPCWVATPSNPHDSHGLVTVGCPKVWRSDRVFTVLDGMLRDVDSITLKALQDLNPNAANLAQIVSVVTDLQASVQFNQATAINNQFKLQQMKTQRAADLKNFESQQKFIQDRLREKEHLGQESAELRRQQLEAVRAGHTDGTQEPLKNIQTQLDTLQKQMDAIDKQISAQKIQEQSLSADAAPSLPQPTPINALADLPEAFSKPLQDALQQPTFPPAMQMDNVIELLHQRLAREFGVMYDDLVRQSKDYDVYLVQFDIGVTPRHDAKDRELKVKFHFKDPAVLAYELYPGTSSYNVMRGLDKTNRLGISGVAQTILGFGMAASFKRDRHEIRSGLSQSLYVSGFGAGSNDFGWLIGAAPFENFLNPGNRIVHALLLVPKHEGRNNLSLTVSYCWPRKETRYQYWWTSHSQGCINEERPVSINVRLPRQPRIKVTKLAYDPADLKDIPGSAASASAGPTTNTVLLTFAEPIDPNLTITAANKIIRRVRDVRGRAMYGPSDAKLAGNPDEQTAISASRFGFLEKDKIDPDTWLQLSSKTLALSISKETAGTNIFPVITLSDPGAEAGELVDLLDQNADIRISQLRCLGRDNFLHNALPLFTEPYPPGRIKAYVDAVEQVDAADPASKLPKQIRVNSETRRHGSTVWLHHGAQVVLQVIDPSELFPEWVLKCDQEEGSLSCKVPFKEIENICKQSKETACPPTRFKVWVDQPPYYERPGLWADDDLVPSGKTWEPQAYAVADWSQIHELSCPGCGGRADHWEATIKLKNLDLPSSGEACVKGLAEVNRQIADLKRALLEEPTDLPNRQNTGRKAVAGQTAAESEKSGKDSETVQQERSQAASVRDKFAKLKQNAIEAKIDKSEGTLTLSIPFVVLPALTGRLHVERGDCESDNSERNPLILPELASHLEPNIVIVSDLQEGVFRLEGQRLRAVDQVRLEGNGKVIITPALRGLNSVDFTPKYDGRLLTAGTYRVSVVIGTMTIEVQMADPNKKLIPAVIKIEAPKTTDGSSTPDQPPGGPASGGKSNINVDLSLTMKGTAPADMKIDKNSQPQAPK